MTTRAIRVNRLALISFVSGLLTLLCLAGIDAASRLAPTNDDLIVTLVDGVLIPVRNLSVPVALVTGILALREIRRKGGAEKGKTLAWLGIAIGIGWIVFFILVVLAFILLSLRSRAPAGLNGLAPILILQHSWSARFIWRRQDRRYDRYAIDASIRPCPSGALASR
ncbi:MAG: DUF4190 domain-containing protein [Roseiflexus sp.]|nr:DUF4190 domain-containing protein [Roseiflexus sp.]MDW8146961.1 DUF4190 domain-containing protein [Roseiflexaceae bacterium]